MLTAEQTLTQTCAVELSRAALVALLDRAKHVVPTRFPKPILMCVHLEASESLLRLQATDGELSLFAQMPVDGSLLACVVPLAELQTPTQGIQASRRAVMSLSDDGERLLINGGRVEHATPNVRPRGIPAGAVATGGRLDRGRCRRAGTRGESDEPRRGQGAQPVRH